jgi:hypothetical protein
MAKVIEFYVRDLFPKKVKSVPRDQRREVIEFPKGKKSAADNSRRLVSSKSHIRSHECAISSPCSCRASCANRLIGRLALR